MDFRIFDFTRAYSRFHMNVEISKAFVKYIRTVWNYQTLRDVFSRDTLGRSIRLNDIENNILNCKQQASTGPLSRSSK